MAKKKKGPKGGIKHTPGRGHDSKSTREKKKRFRRKAAKIRKAREADLHKQWDEWDALPADAHKLRPDKKPRRPRPTNES